MASFLSAKQPKLSKLSGKYSRPLSMSVFSIFNHFNLVKFCKGFKEPTKRLLPIFNFSKLTKSFKSKLPVRLL
ncbi:MAG: hypothetical protein MRECE_38c018 [Mycoplasmataceae bacterium CE_OT135]|nr:MAG: hypothetical protein MRECE_38c018 [Mycoplasmataceae bacterium CE_OT135]